MPIGVLKIKLGACLTMPTKRFFAALDEIGRECNRARNHAQRRWLRWREDNPDWKPVQRRVRDGSPKVTKGGKPVMEDDAISQDFCNELNHYASDLIPHVSPSVSVACAGEVVKKLSDRMPWNHEGESRYRWQALLNDEVSPSTYRGAVIPVHNRDSGVCYAGDATGTVGKTGRACGKDSCVLAVALYSRRSGREILKHVVRMEVRQFPAGKRKLIRRIVRGEDGCSLSCSKLCKIGSEWYFMLTYKAPEKDHHLNPGNAATLYPLPTGAPYPFMIEFPDGKNRLLGDGKMYETQHGRLDTRRQMIRYRSRDGTGRGRGKKRMYRNLKPMERSFINLENRFTHKLIADILRACIDNDCGTLVYREPTMPIREDRMWFRRRPGKWGLIPFGWSVFESDLRHKMEANIVAMEKKMTRIGAAEHREKFEKWYPKKKDGEK